MCTSFVIGDPTIGLVYARTMEFTLQLHSAVVVVPVGTTFTGTDEKGTIGSGGLTWTATHGAVYANALGIEGCAIDGMNDAGLVVGSLNFPVSADYLTVSDTDQAKSIASFEVAHFLLTTCATVAEARAALESTPVQNVGIAAYGGQVPPLHWTIHDTAGNHAIVEYVGGKLAIYDNPTTVMTNEPPFPIQLANLAEYSYLSAEPPAPIRIGELSLAAPSSGGGMKGIPGGFLATARFVRAFFARNCAPAFSTAAQGTDLARHLINGFDIPPGSVQTPAGAGESGGVTGIETTEWSIIHDLANRVSYLNTYEGPEWTRLDVRALCAAAKGLTVIGFPAPAAFPELTIGS